MNGGNVAKYSFLRSYKSIEYKIHTTLNTLEQEMRKVD